MGMTDRPRGTPGIEPRQPISVAVAMGRKGESGGVVGKDRFWLVNARADGMGRAAVRGLHASFARFNGAPPEQCRTVRGNIVHAQEEEACWTSYTAQTLPGHQHPRLAPSCQGDGARAQRWMPERAAYVEIPCPNERCQYRQPTQGTRGPGRSLCNPLAKLVFQLRFESMPCLPAVFSGRGYETTGALKGFFLDIERQANALGLERPNLYGLPFALELSSRSNPEKQTKWWAVSMVPDLPAGMTLQGFLLRQTEERGQLAERRTLLLAPTVQEVMDAEIVDDGRAGNLGEPPPDVGISSDRWGQK